MDFSINKENKQIRVIREFAAPLQTVWSAWTDSKILDKWWAPKPWVAKTKTMDFKEGGSWLYAMVGPTGEEHWARFDFTSIKPLVSYSGKDAFCDSNGKINETFARSLWTNKFSETDGKTQVSITIQLNEVSDIEQMIEMGFKEGFTVAMEGLDELLAAEK